MSPADTTTAFICRVAAVAIFVVDILFPSLLLPGEDAWRIRKEGWGGMVMGA